ncbi:MAG: cation diffusion facilitator family transporter [Candidatus Omnitrophota bacterium]|jgi:cation diffusion facilitator family transporter
MNRRQIYATRVSMFGALAIFFISAGAGLALDSITLLLDASASLVILAVAFFMHTSIKKLQSPPDRFFNFGYGKYEPLTLIAQGVLIITTCLISIKFALQDIIHADNVEDYGIAVIATFLAGIIGIFVTTYIKRSARLTHSQILDTAGMHWLADTLMSFGVCAGFALGFILQELGYYRITPYVDPVMAIVLALILIRMPIRIIMRNGLELLDAVPPGDIHKKVVEVAQGHKPKSFGIHRLRTRKAGERVFADICFIVKEDLTVAQVQELADNFERDLKELLPVSDVVVYFKPRPGAGK